MSECKLVCEECVTEREMMELRPYPKVLVLFMTIFLGACAALGFVAVRMVWSKELHGYAYLHAGMWAIVIGGYLWKFIRRNVIGRSLYIFFDDKENVHRHLSGISPIGFRNWTEFYEARHVVLNVRIGGWTRATGIKGDRNVFLGLHRWNLESWTGEDLVLRDIFGNQICHLSPGGASIIQLEELLKIPLRFDDVGDMLTRLNVADKERKSLEAYQNERGALLNDRVQRDRFGQVMVSLIRLMEESKDTLGRSKHAQIMREFLEQSLNGVTKSTLDEWRKKAEGEFGPKHQLDEIVARVMKKPPADEPATPEAPPAPPG